MTHEDVVLIAFALRDLRKHMNPKQWLIVVNWFVDHFTKHVPLFNQKRFLRQVSGKPRKGGT